VTYIPYLHWGLENWQTNQQSGEATKEKTLTDHYTPEKTGNHAHHVRRTLDQYYYHTLSDTSSRDKNQTVSRYRRRNKLEASVITMVDQLWLWVLKNTEDGVDTVISCFPAVDPNEQKPPPDPTLRTDVIRSISRYMRDESSSIQSAYDLAGLIAAKCSRVYMDKGSTLNLGNSHDSVLFSEVYEATISNIVSDILTPRWGYKMR
jgi:hypothetical protein